MKRFELLGNDRIKRAAAEGDFGSSVIFDGGPGTGKKTAAAYAAAALLCRDRGQNRPCGRCRSCVQALAGTHPDITLFNPEGENIKVADIRRLRMESFMTPTQSPFKVFIVNRADLMNREAQNAFLKVLEEPISSIFILLCHNAYSLLQTVRSRCRVYSMEPIGVPQAEEFLTEYFAGSERAVSRAEIANAAGLCHGSIGQAIKIIEKGQTKAAAVAADFLTALDKNEISIMEACVRASALNRTEYGDFCLEVTEGLVRAALDRPERREMYIAVYDHIQEQKDRLADNGGVFPLAGLLSVFCGKFYRR